MRDSGSAPLTYDAVKVWIAGKERTHSLYSTRTLDSGSDNAESLLFNDGPTVEPGSKTSDSHALLDRRSRRD